MPCRDGGPTEDQVLKAKVDTLTRLLCRATDILTQNGWIGCDAELFAWKAQHDLDDQKRLECERVERERERKKQEDRVERERIIASLTPEARRLLGV